MPLTKERDTQARPVPALTRVVPVKTATTIYKGSLVALEAGYAIPGATALNLVAIGRAAETVANAGANGALSIAVERGIFGYKPLAADAPTLADVGKDVFIADDEQVARTNGGNTRSVAGKLFALQDGVAWVEFA